MGMGQAYHDIESIRIVLFDLFPLLIWVISIQFNDDIACADLLRNFGLDTLVGCYDYF
jgi:hypothetical protein